MRIYLVAAGAALTLSACGGNNQTAANDDMNAMTTDNMTATDNMMVDQNAAMTGAGGMDGNTATNATTENMMKNDLTHNEADTNLANGM